jgi:preprotein translocase subunit YajC
MTVGGNQLPILPLVGIALLFWLLFIRPAQRRQRELAGLQGSLSVGDDVMTTSGIFGTVRGIDDEAISLEVADGVTLRVVRAAIGSVGRSAAQPAERSQDEETKLAGPPADESEEK